MFVFLLHNTIHNWPCLQSKVNWVSFIWLYFCRERGSVYSIGRSETVWYLEAKCKFECLLWSKDRTVNLAKEFSTKNSGLFDFCRNLSLSHFKSATTQYQISEPPTPEFYRFFTFSFRILDSDIRSHLWSAMFITNKFFPRSNKIRWSTFISNSFNIESFNFYIKDLTWTYTYIAFILIILWSVISILYIIQQLYTLKAVDNAAKLHFKL